MKYELTIECDTLGEYPVQAICNILQTQAEKLLRWHDTTEWSDTLVGVDGKAVGKATLAKSYELPQVYKDILDKYLAHPMPTSHYQAFNSHPQTLGAPVDAA